MRIGAGTSFLTFDRPFRPLDRFYRQRLEYPPLTQVASE